MKKIFFFFLMISALSSTAQTRDIKGAWEGKLNAGVELRLIFTFSKTNDGGYSAVLESPDQEATFNCSKLIVSDDSLIAEVFVIGGKYKAAFLNDSTLEGSWLQRGASLPLTVKHVGKVSVLTRPQTPKPPFTYNSEDVIYQNADSSLHFGATFTYPKTGGPFTTAILITGSGQQDRDETIMNHKPFAVIADWLTKNGYAVLRVDDRGKGKTSSVDLSKASSADFAKDVLAGIAYLQKRIEVNKNKIGLIGHSEGGLIGSIIAAGNKDVNFFIMLAGTGIKGDELLAEQGEAIMVSTGSSKEAAVAYKNLYARVIKNAIEKDTASAITASMDDYRKWKKTTDPKTVTELEIQDEAIALGMMRSLVTQLSVAWLKFFLLTDPSVYIQQLKCKVLALNGSKDIQVLPQQNLAAINAALKKSGSKKYETKELPGLNHLFQHCNKCSIEEYGQLEETFAPEALDIMLAWLNENIGK